MFAVLACCACVPCLGAVLAVLLCGPPVLTPAGLAAATGGGALESWGPGPAGE